MTGIKATSKTLDTQWSIFFFIIIYERRFSGVSNGNRGLTNIAVNAKQNYVL